MLSCPSALLTLPLLLAAGVSSAGAQVVRVDVHGSCPSVTQLESALVREGISRAAKPGAQSAAKVSVSTGSDGATLVLSDPSGHMITRRDAKGADCAALADAFALIVALRLQGADTATARVLPQKARKRQTNAGRKAASGNAERAAPRTEPVATTSNRRARVALSDVGANDRRWIAFAAHVGAAFDVDPAEGTKFGGADVVVNRREGLSFRAAVSRLGASEVGTGDVSWSAWSLRGELGSQLDLGPVRLRPAVGGALVASTVTLTEGRTKRFLRRLHPAFTGSVATGVGIAKGVQLRALLEATLFPLPDRYDSNGMEVARMPRATFAAGLGVEFVLSR